MENLTLVWESPANLAVIIRGYRNNININKIKQYNKHNWKPHEDQA